MGTASPPAQRFGADDLRTFTAAIFRTAGVADKDAQVVAHGLVDSNLRGVDTHGITRIPIYLERLNAGLVNAQARPRIVTESPTTVAVDGDNGLGHVVCDFAIDATIERAKANGACWTGIRESNHNGSQGYWALRGARAGLMTWAFTNGEAIVAPWGGSEKFVSTNPICIAMPTDPPDELVLDMATTQVAAGHIFLAQSRGEPIPRAGRSTPTATTPPTRRRSSTAARCCPWAGTRAPGCRCSSTSWPAFSPGPRPPWTWAACIGSTRTARSVSGIASWPSMSRA